MTTNEFIERNKDLLYREQALLQQLQRVYAERQRLLDEESQRTARGEERGKSSPTRKGLTVEQRRRIAAEADKVVARRNARILKSIALLVLIFSFARAGFSQFSVGASAGYTTADIGAAEIVLQYTNKVAFVEGGYILLTSNEVQNGTYLNIRAGHRVTLSSFFVEPSAGYARVVRSSDRPELNTNTPIYNLRIGKNINSGSLFLSGAYAEKIWVCLIGLRYNFKK